MFQQSKSQKGTSREVDSTRIVTTREFLSRKNKSPLRIHKNGLPYFKDEEIEIETKTT